jgi:hypothetical protein
MKAENHIPQEVGGIAKDDAYSKSLYPAYIKVQILEMI